MYEVQMRYKDVSHNNSPFNFKCEKFDIDGNNYKFVNVFIHDFLISDMEINNEDISLIKIN